MNKQCQPKTLFTTLFFLLFLLSCRSNDMVPTLPLFIRIGINWPDQSNKPMAPSYFTALRHQQKKLSRIAITAATRKSHLNITPAPLSVQGDGTARLF